MVRFLLSEKVPGLNPDLGPVPRTPCGFSPDFSHGPKHIIEVNWWHKTVRRCEYEHDVCVGPKMKW